MCKHKAAFSPYLLEIVSVYPSKILAKLPGKERKIGHGRRDNLCFY